MEPIYSTINIERENNTSYLIGIRGENKNPSTGKDEILAIFYAHNDVIYQCDNIVIKKYLKFEFVKDYKLYNLQNIYPDAKYIETNLDENAFFENAFCISSIEEERKEDFKRLQNNLLNPHGRLILHLNYYYIENAEMFFDLGFDRYGEYFYNYIERHFPVDEISLRKSYIRYLEREEFEKVREKINILGREFSLTQFDLSNLAYVEKMEENFLKACECYSKIELKEDSPEFLFKDYIFCLENTGNKKKANEIRTLLNSIKGDRS